MRFVPEPYSLVAIVRLKVVNAGYPCCGTCTTRIHSWYERTLLDLPWWRVPVRLRVQVRRFFCDVPSCERTIFAERFPEMAVPYAHRTTRRDEWVQSIGIALGGEAGARLLKELGIVSSPDTICNS